MVWITLVTVVVLLVLGVIRLNNNYFMQLVSHRLYQSNKAYEASDLLGDTGRHDTLGVRLRSLIVELGPPSRMGISDACWQARVNRLPLPSLVSAVNDSVNFCQRVGLDRAPRPIIPRSGIHDCAC